MKCPLINLGLVLDVFVSGSLLRGSKYWADGMTLDRLSILSPLAPMVPRSRGAVPLGRPWAKVLIIGKTLDMSMTGMTGMCQKIESWLPLMKHLWVAKILHRRLSLRIPCFPHLKPNPAWQRIQRWIRFPCLVLASAWDQTFTVAISLAADPNRHLLFHLGGDHCWSRVHHSCVGSASQRVLGTTPILVTWSSTYGISVWFWPFQTWVWGWNKLHPVTIFTSYQQQTALGMIVSWSSLGYVGHFTKYLLKFRCVFFPTSFRPWP